MNNEFIVGSPAYVELDRVGTELGREHEGLEGVLTCLE
jgi:hypothetical protein